MSANKKISQYDETTAPQDADILVIVQGGANKKTTKKNLLKDTEAKILARAKQAGTYSETETYAENDVVQFEGSSYIAIPETTGHAPTDETYWTPFASKG